MNNLWKNYRFSRELKRLAKESAAQGKPLSILEDAVFKAMLSADNEDSREALRSLLSACTRREVSAVRVINNELIPAHLDAKMARLDVHVTFNDGESADLEMQTSKSDDDLKTRAEFYTAMLLSSQRTRGKPYRRIKRVYQIFFLNCVLFPDSGKLSRRYFYQEEEERDRLSEVTEIIFYELPKLEARLKDILEGRACLENLRKEEKWCMFMKYRHEERAEALIEQLCLKEEGIMKAERAVTKVSRDYLRFAREMAEIKNSMDRAQAQLIIQEELRKEILQKCRDEGMEEGRAKSALEIARKMKKAGRPLSEIEGFTGLQAETIEQL
jgi:predicted transposase/invertase (TIGR01784 family)